MPKELLLLGVDGGGTRCCARLCDAGGNILGEGTAGPANLRLGVAQSLAAVRQSAGQCLRQAGLSWHDRRIVACLALAGASEPANLAEARAFPHPFDLAIFTTDAQAACVGAHKGRDGGIIIVGTGSIGWGTLGGKEFRVGGWGFPISDEGSGAWIGCEAVRRALLAHDGMVGWTPFLGTVFERFDSDAHNIVSWMSTARPRDFGAIAPVVVEHAAHGDPEALALMRRAAEQIDAIAERLNHLGVRRLSLAGGLADRLEPFLSVRTKRGLVAPVGNALSGAVHLARGEAERLALTSTRA